MIIIITIYLRDRWRGGVRGAVGVRCPPGAVPDLRLQVVWLLHQGSCQRETECYDYDVIAAMITIILFSLILLSSSWFYNYQCKGQYHSYVLLWMYSHCSYLYIYHYYYYYTTAFRRKTATTTRQEPFRWKPEIPTCPRSSKNHLTTGFRMSSQSLGMTMWLLRMAPTAQPSSAAFNCLELSSGLPGANCKLSESPTGSQASKQARRQANKPASK